jgi:hypothetical protein
MFAQDKFFDDISLPPSVPRTRQKLDGQFFIGD